MPVSGRFRPDSAARVPSDRRWGRPSRKLSAACTPDLMCEGGRHSAVRRAGVSLLRFLPDRRGSGCERRARMSMRACLQLRRPAPPSVGRGASPRASVGQGEPASRTSPSLPRMRRPRSARSAHGNRARRTAPIAPRRTAGRHAWSRRQQSNSAEGRLTRLYPEKADIHSKEEPNRSAVVRRIERPM